MVVLCREKSRKLLLEVQAHLRPKSRRVQGGNVGSSTWSAILTFVEIRNMGVRLTRKQRHRRVTDLVPFDMVIHRYVTVLRFTL